MSCKKCGICCQWMYIITYEANYKPSELDVLRGMEKVDSMTVRIPLACKEFDPETKLCKIHDTKPKVCRNYPEVVGYPIPKECKYKEE